MLARAVVAAFCMLPSIAAQEHVTLTADDGAVIHADVYGKGRTGVVLVHGGRFDKASWAKQARVLADRGFRVVAIDLRGKGESRGPGDKDQYTAPLHLDVLAAVRHLSKSGATKVSLVGGSMGATAAADAAILARPGEIEAIVLLAGTPKLAPEKLPGRKLFIIARDDANASGPRLPGFQAAFDKTHEPKQMLVVDGDAHAQFLFESQHGERVLNEIVRFLSAR